MAGAPRSLAFREHLGQGSLQSLDVGSISGHRLGHLDGLPFPRPLADAEIELEQRLGRHEGLRPVHQHPHGPLVVVAELPEVLPNGRVVIAGVEDRIDAFLGREGVDMAQLGVQQGLLIRFEFLQEGDQGIGKCLFLGVPVERFGDGDGTGGQIRLPGGGRNLTSEVTRVERGHAFLLLLQDGRCPACRNIPEVRLNRDARRSVCRTIRIIDGLCRVCQADTKSFGAEVYFQAI